MDEPQRGALILVRFVGVALIGLTFMQLSLYVLDLHFHGHAIPVMPFIAWTVPLLIGLVLLAKAKAVAQWITDRLE